MLLPFCGSFVRVRDAGEGWCGFARILFLRATGARLGSAWWPVAPGSTGLGLFEKLHRELGADALAQRRRRGAAEKLGIELPEPRAGSRGRCAPDDQMEPDRAALAHQAAWSGSPSRGYRMRTGGADRGAA